MVYGGYVYNLTVNCIYPLFYGYVGVCVTSLWGERGPCVINRVWAVGSLRALFRYNFSLVWVLVLDLGGLSGAFSGNTLVLEGAL